MYLQLIIYVLIVNIVTKRRYFGSDHNAHDEPQSTYDITIEAIDSGFGALLLMACISPNGSIGSVAQEGRKDIQAI